MIGNPNDPNDPNYEPPYPETPTTGTPPSSTDGIDLHNDIADVWATPPADGDWAGWFLRNVQSEGRPPSPQNLEGLESRLNRYGIKVLRNAQGIAGKIQIPGGKILDVGQAFSSGDPSKMAWQVLEGGGDDDGFSWDTAQFPTPDPYMVPARPDYLQGEYKPPTWDEKFTAPDADSLKQDPGYQSRLAAAQKAFERGAAAKGSLLSGGSQIALGRQQQDIASNEYGVAFGRALDTYRQKYGQFQDALTANYGARQLNEGAYQNDVANKYNQYGTRYRTYRDAIDDQFRLSQLGLQAAQGGGI